MIKIETSEVKRILEMHSKLKKKPILEQNTAPDSSTETPKVNQDEVDLKLIQDAEKAGCLKNGKSQYLKGTKKPVYVATTVKSGKVVYFYPDMTYKFADGSKSGKWKCSKVEEIKIQQDALKAEEDKKPKPLNTNQLKVLELIKPFRWVNTPVPTDVDIDYGAFLKMDLSKSDGGEFTNLSTEDKALAEKYSKYFQTGYPSGFFVYKKVAAQTPTQIGKGSKVEVTIESCKTSIESLYNNMNSPRTYPLAAEDKTNHKTITKTCIEPANKGKFTIRFGLNSKIKELKNNGVI